MGLVKAKNTLLQKQQISNMVQSIVLEIKEEFKNLDITNLKKDKELLKSVMNAIEKYSSDTSLVSAKNYSLLDKVEICIQIYNAIFDDLTEDEINELKNDMEFLISNNMVKISNFFLRIIKQILKEFIK